ncbi:hypothetical protein [Sulfobacillus harzensis]|uniref:Uncharacterized protein n=1 Tax=Sulfobacillus harzensis TaxID=2729629 RepID=A0A7Y0Q5U0_9FIRM|nr:hypothetical protein [Sulfobacillus harzensis]NMP24664.1 hypothetical protein [Sulfobacillus harzensis]
MLWVVGNRTVKEARLLTDQVIMRAKLCGLVSVATFTRVTNKRMRQENSPANEVGKKRSQQCAVSKSYRVSGFLD